MSKAHSQTTVYKSKSGKEFKYDAREKLAIDDVDARCDDIAKAAKEGCKSINNDIKNVQIGQETLSVADSSLEPALEEVGNYIDSIATAGVEATTNEVKEEASAAFEKLQKEEDERAKTDCEAENARWEAEQAEKNKES